MTIGRPRGQSRRTLIGPPAGGRTSAWAPTSSSTRQQNKKLGGAAGNLRGSAGGVVRVAWPRRRECPLRCPGKDSGAAEEVTGPGRNVAFPGPGPVTPPSPGRPSPHHLRVGRQVRQMSHLTKRSPAATARSTGALTYPGAHVLRGWGELLSSQLAHSINYLGAVLTHVLVSPAASYLTSCCCMSRAR